MKYIQVLNSGGKCWRFPLKNLKTGVLIYQPSNFTGKILKQILPIFENFPFLVKIPCVSKLMCISLVEVVLPDEIISLSKKAFPDFDEVLYSIFYGTPGADQKTVIQIYSCKGILGYLKITDNSTIIDSFKKEAHVLKKLSSYGISGLPNPILISECMTGDVVYIQSTEKNIHSYSDSQLTDKHISFLETVYRKTTSQCIWKDSDCYRVLSGLKDKVSNLSESEFLWYENYINILNEYFGNNFFRSVYSHGDFTPWNIYFNHDVIHVFDWEYVSERNLPYIDCLHFLIQPMMFMKRITSSQIMDAYIEFKRNFELSFLSSIDLDFVLIYYLLSMIDRYFSQAHIDKDSEKIRLVAMWKELLEMIR